MTKFVGISQDRIPLIDTFNLSDKLAMDLQ